MSLRCTVAFALSLLAGSAVPEGQPAAAHPEQVEQGRSLYEIYCLSCHGDQADGHGPRAAALSPRPADLTRLRAADGSFPAEEIRRTIDGRDTLPGHPRKEMPIWGLTLQQLDSDADQEEEVRAKIRSIVTYLESIQLPPD